MLDVTWFEDFEVSASSGHIPCNEFEVAVKDPGVVSHVAMQAFL